MVTFLEPIFGNVMNMAFWGRMTWEFDTGWSRPFDEQLKIRGQFKHFNLGENDLDLDIGLPCFAI